MKTTLSKLLAGTTLGRTQSVGIMQVIPLLSELEDERFAPPSKLSMSTLTYGHMRFRNPTDKIGLIPHHATYVVKEKAQDHAMARAGLVPAKGASVFTDAMCVQSTQGGYIADGHHALSVLPLALREQAQGLKGKEDFRKLWTHIDKFNRQFGINQGAHLEFFLTQFEKEMDQFVAEFESLPHQVGAIILINGEVVGVERTPNCAYWLDVWEPLIRICYGSLALSLARQKGELNPAKQPLQEDGVSDVNTLFDAVTRAETEAENIRKETLKQALAEQLSVTKDGVTEPVVATLENPRFLGQAVMDGQAIPYVSLIQREAWIRTAKWKQAKPLTVA